MSSSQPQAQSPDGGPRGEQPQNPSIAGIGASAGGLEALEQFLSQVPDESGIAFVIIQHLDPHRESMLTDLLGRRTKMPVVEAKDGTHAEADHVYVIAPGTMLGLAKGSFQVTAVDRDRHGPVDAFFRALADDQGESAIGIVLSGSGTDGTHGLRSIRDRGGLTLAQTPETAKHESMPRSAIEAGVVDHVLPVEQMPARLLEHARGLTERRASPSDKQLAADLGRVCEVLRRKTGHDFSQYKHGTMIRRLRRRMQLRRLSSTDEYLELLATDPEEPELLVKDLLIGVTQFFRDPEAFDYLAQQALTRIVARKSAGEAVRIWVPGCASGEEAYSLGMLVREQLSEVSSTPLVQIFATDIDAEALTEARQGRYAAGIAEHVSPKRLARFFTREGTGYQAVKELREMCVFSQHSLIRDPPFSAVDLVSCRNVLIYLDADLQKKLVPLFHYALKPGGFLFLGPSEGLAGYPELFETVDKHHRVFKRAESVARQPVDFPLVGRAAPRATPTLVHAPAPAPSQQQAVCAAFERLMLQEYSPAGALVNERGDVLCVAGLTGRFLQPPVGVLTTNILDIAHANLRVELRVALHAAVTNRKKFVRSDVQVEVEGQPRPLRLTVRPLPGIKQEGLYTVVLEERAREPQAEAAEPTEASASTDQSAMEQLESELRTTRADLRVTVEELESANEELKSSNEELLSTNEELQSANEELQTSQEELKSVNEELETVNSELQRKVEELGRANSDLQNLFNGTDVATLFLDRDLRVTKFAPAAKALFRLIEGDIGRPISDLAPRLVGLDLASDVSEVLRTLRPVEREVEALDRRAWYMLRILPYRTVEDVIAGAVVTLVDITQLKRADADVRRLATVVLDSNDAVTMQDLEGRILAWNRGAERMYGYTRDEALQMNAEDLVPEEGRPQVKGFLEAIERGEEVASLEVRRRTKDGRALDVWLTTTRLVGDQGRPVAVATTERDISERKRAEQALRAAAERFRRAIEDAPIPVIMHAEDGEVLQISRSWTELTGYTREEVRSLDAWLRSAYGAGADAVRDHVRALFSGDRSAPGMDFPIRTRDGQIRQWSVSASSPGTLEDGRRFIVAMAEDVTERKQAEDALREADRRKNEFLAMLSHELRNPLAPIRNSLYILDRAPPGGEQARRAQAVIDRQVSHLTRLVEDLLDFTRVTRGKAQLQREPLEVNELVQRAVEDLRSVFVTSDVHLEVLPATSEVWVSGDRTRLAQAIGNLLQNAAKFTPRGGRTTVSVHRDSARDQAVIRVKDTGSGIAPEVLPRLFVAFSQADTTLDRSKGGLGLGLALVKGLVETHGGSVSGESDGLGKGATFTIALPLTTPTTSTTSKTSTKPPRRTRDHRATRRVLVIEDNVDSANSLREALELGEHVVEVAYSGPEGLEKARAFMPDLVLCDIGLPGIDGYGVARAMRADPQLGRVTLVALTGYAQPEDVAKAMEAGFDDHLPKPPSIETLERTLARAGNGGQGGSPGAG